jgi:hypothetical protein
MTFEVTEEALWAKIGKQSIQIEMLQAELKRLSDECAKLEIELKGKKKRG